MASMPLVINNHDTLLSSFLFLTQLLVLFFLPNLSPLFLYLRKRLQRRRRQIVMFINELYFLRAGEMVESLPRMLWFEKGEHVRSHSQR